MINFKKYKVWICVAAILIVIVAAGCLLTDPKPNGASIGIIGGADGPTAIVLSSGDANRTELAEADDTQLVDAVNAELQLLHEMGILCNEIAIDSEKDFRVFEKPAQTEPDLWFPGRLLPKCYYVSGRTADDKFGANALLDAQTGRIINLSVDSKDIEDIFSSDITLDEFCTMLNIYWGFGGYEIVDSEGEYGHFDAPAGKAKLSEMQGGNFYVSVSFKGDQPDAVVCIQPLTFPAYSTLVFGFNGHLVG